MSVVYAETSAVLRWLLGAPDGPAVQSVLEATSDVVTSALTAAEVGRALRRLAASGQISEAQRLRLHGAHAAAAAHWTLHAVTDAVLTRAAAAFPVDAIRTLDAIHLATVLAYSQAVTPVTVLSTDARIRDNARALGLTLAPA